MITRSVGWKAPAIACALIACAFSTRVRADELPHFQPGMWEFKRTVEGPGAKPQSMAMQRCTNPSADMAKQNASAGGLGCKTSPVSRSGSSYSFTLDCEIEGKKLQSKSVITAESDSAYQVEVETDTEGHHGKEVLLAKRLGECPK